MGVNLKEVRERIGSVKSTQQITKAMKMVSAAKLRKAQEAIQKIRPYASKLQEMLANILSNLQDEDAVTSLGVEREVEKVAIVCITSSRGLCGGFNANIIKGTRKLLEEKYAEQLAAGNVTMYCIGKKGADYFKNTPNLHVNTKYLDLFTDLSFDNTSRVSEELIQKFEDKKFDAIDIVYGKFRNAAVQDTTVEQFLPVPKLEVDEETTEKKDILADYIFEPDMKTLLETLVPSILKMQFLKCNLDTHASEHGARMTAMDSATENANDLLKELQISYNKARQEAITRELSEIVGGAAALDG